MNPESKRQFMVYHLTIGFLISALLIVQFSDTYISFKTKAFASVLILAAAFLTKLFTKIQTSHIIRPRFRIHSVATTGVFAFHILHDLYYRKLDYGLKQAIIVSMSEWVIIGSFILIPVISKPQFSSLAWFPVCIAIAGYAALNLAAWMLGLRVTVSDETTMGSIGSITAERMYAPFSNGINTFGAICTAGACIAFLVAYYSFKEGKKSITLWSTISLIINFSCIVLVQFRSSLLAFLLLAILFFVQNIGRAQLMSISAGHKVSIAIIGIMVMLPLAFYRLAAASFMDAIIPESLYQTFGRHSSDFTYLGGRAFIWDSGWTQIEQGLVGLFGQGIERRDSSLVLGGFLGVEITTQTSYHNGFMEFIMVYGVPASILFVIMLLLLAQSIYWDAIRSVGIHSMRVHSIRMTLFGAFVTIAYLEAFSVSPFFWGLLFCILLTNNPPDFNTIPIKS